MRLRANPTRAAVVGAVLAALAVGVGRWGLAEPPRGPAPDRGPDVVILRELGDQYEPVPFEHRRHARMAEMWGGCTTCHHRPPAPGAGPATRPADGPASLSAAGPTQEGAAATPACKSCHPASDKDAALRIPNLKGAYHRQCLSCHREWTHQTACVICHKPRTDRPAEKEPTRDDVLGRMHPPIPEPDTKLYRARFTPADGANVLFRHKEHTAVYGLKCSTCHHRDNCSTCHNSQGEFTGSKPLQPGDTWRESHGPCLSCHQQDRCRHCHYKDTQPPPKAFDHQITGLSLDGDHGKLPCASCHGGLALAARPTCGDGACHKNDQNKTISYPARRPGQVVTTRPGVEAAVGPKGAVTR